jgi:hypothetical protein
MALPLTSSSIASPPTPLLPRRRRGAQPGNRNALTHGLYSARNPASLAAFSASLARINTERRFFPKTAVRHIPMLQFIAARAIQPSAGTLPHPAQLELAIRLINTSVRIKKVWNNLPAVEDQRENIRLATAAETPLSLVCLSFTEHGITRDAYSFLNKLPQSDRNTTFSPAASSPFIEQPLHPYIPDRQCALIASLILPRERTSRGGTDYIPEKYSSSSHFIGFPIMYTRIFSRDLSSRIIWS